MFEFFPLFIPSYFLQKARTTEWLRWKIPLKWYLLGIYLVTIGHLEFAPFDTNTYHNGWNFVGTSSTSALNQVSKSIRKLLCRTWLYGSVRIFIRAKFPHKFGKFHISCHLAHNLRIKSFTGQMRTKKFYCIGPSGGRTALEVSQEGEDS